MLLLWPCACNGEQFLQSHYRQLGHSLSYTAEGEVVYTIVSAGIMRQNRHVLCSVKASDTLYMHVEQANNMTR